LGGAAFFLGLETWRNHEYVGAGLFMVAAAILFGALVNAFFRQ